MNAECYTKTIAALRPWSWAPNEDLINHWTYQSYDGIGMWVSCVLDEWNVCNANQISFSSVTET